MTTHRERLLGQARADLTALPYVITDQYGVHAPECPCGQETAMSNTLPEVPMPDDPAAVAVLTGQVDQWWNALTPGQKVTAYQRVRRDDPRDDQVATD